MELLINLGITIGFILGLVLLLLTMFVLHTYESQTKKKPPSIQFWPFNAQIKEYYPGLSKIGRYLEIGAIVCFLPYFCKLLTTA